MGTCNAWLAGLMSGMLAASPALAQLRDQHSTMAIAAALATPIPSGQILEAQKVHDDLLRTGKFQGVATFLVTDERSTRLQQLTERLLASIDENPARWQVRLLDTEPAITNAFVTGGMYIYVFTGLVADAASEDELAFVLAHELGHSLLKHNLRRQEDMSTQLARIADLAGAIAGGKPGRSLGGASQATMAAYSRVDEEEADALAVLIARRASFNPLRGADFFTRNARAEQKAKSQAQVGVDSAYRDAMAARASCGRMLADWNANPHLRTQQNAVIAPVLLRSLCSRITSQAGATFSR